ncbi:MAG TPA: glycosyltransferase [Chloroflexota bacterium]|nr:glycosyltransferase [Chloroflexota bacterium]
MRAAFMPVAFGYGTTARCLAVARELQRRGHESVFLAGAAVGPMIERNGFAFRAIPDVRISGNARQSPAHQLFAQESTPGFLAHQMEAVVEALRQTHADLLVYSNSLTAAVAASIVGKPSISIFAPSILEVPSLGFFVPMLRTWLASVALRRRVRSRLTTPIYSAFLGDRSFVPSIPPLIYWPLLVPPDLIGHRSEVVPVGALLAQAPADLPPDGVLLDELGVKGRPFVYATLGGEIFDLEMIRAIAEGIRHAECHGLVSGGHRVTDEVSQRLSDEQVQVVHYLPDDFRAIKTADLLIWHGGHQTMLEAVAVGTPAIGLPYQLDQFANVASLVSYGAAQRLSARRVSTGMIDRAIRTMLHNPRYAERMTALRDINRDYRGAAAIADVVVELTQGMRAWPDE